MLQATYPHLQWHCASHTGDGVQPTPQPKEPIPGHTALDPAAIHNPVCGITVSIYKKRKSDRQITDRLNVNAIFTSLGCRERGLRPQRLQPIDMPHASHS